MEKSRYFIEEKPTSNKALAQWAYSHFDFRTPDYKRLSENTIIQEFGEVWREMKVAGEIQGIKQKGQKPRNLLTTIKYKQLKE